jgi:hypothetical protein
MFPSKKSFIILTIAKLVGFLSSSTNCAIYLALLKYVLVNCSLGDNNCNKDRYSLSTYDYLILGLSFILVIIHILYDALTLKNKSYFLDKSTHGISLN